MVASRDAFTIASRGSKLALWQTEHVRDVLLAATPSVTITVEIVRTTGDRILDVPLARIGDKGLFTRELDEALVARRADFAVHSLKDIPTRVPEGLVIAAIPPRADPADVLIVRKGVPARLAELPAGSRIGTSSLRRRAQLVHRRPDLEILDLRGNVDTRIAKLEAGACDGIVLAAAGLLRLGLEDHISEKLSGDWLPAVGQGALAIVAREDDREVIDLLAPLHDEETARCVTAERSFLRSLEGGCQVPIGALAVISDGSLLLEGFVADLEGSSMLRGRETGRFDEALEIGRRLARRLAAQGAEDLLREVRDGAARPSVSAP